MDVFCSHVALSTQMYVGNYEYEASERELERLFDRYGRVRRVDFKSGELHLFSSMTAW